MKVEEAFLPVAAPASVIPDRKNEYYKSDEDCLVAIGEAMRTEYKMIVEAGFLLQLDDARAAVTYDRMVPPGSFADYRKWVAMHMEVLNHAIAGLPPERIRYHVCWGSWPGPHTTDVPLKDIVDLILSVKVGAYVIEGANPRHEHEWKVWQDVKLPEGKVLIPGVISHATNVVEHPELVAERIGGWRGWSGARTSSPEPTAASRRARSTGASTPRSCGRSSRRSRKARGCDRSNTSLAVEWWRTRKSPGEELARAAVHRVAGRRADPFSSSSSLSTASDRCSSGPARSRTGPARRRRWQDS